jgi:hypothetical protein
VVVLMLSRKGRGWAVKIIAAAALMFALLTVGSVPAFAQGSTGSISGTVTATNGFPLDNATVEAMSGSTVVASATAAADGTYTIDGLSPGSYSVYSSIVFNNFPSGVPGAESFYGDSAQETVPVTADSVTSGINVVLAITPSITGTVTAVSSGQPIDNVVVQVIPVHGSDTPVTGYTGIAYTGPDGEYALMNLPAGNYDITFVDCGNVPYSSTSTCSYASEIYTGQPEGTPFFTSYSSTITQVTVVTGQTTSGIDASLFSLDSPLTVCTGYGCDPFPASAGMTVTGAPNPNASTPGTVLGPTVGGGQSLQFVPTGLSGGQFSAYVFSGTDPITDGQFPSGLSFDTSTGILTVSNDENPGDCNFELTYISPSGQEAFAIVELGLLGTLSGEVSGASAISQSSIAGYTVTAEPASGSSSLSANGPAILSSSTNGPAQAMLRAATNSQKIQKGEVVVTDGNRIVCVKPLKNNKATCLIRGSRLHLGHQRLNFKLTALNFLPHVVSKTVNVKR